MIRGILYALALLFLLSSYGVSSAYAQPSGYAVGGLSGYSGFFGSYSSAGHVAGGGEMLFGRLGAGGETGVIATSSSALVVLSANGVFRFSKPAKGSASPFVTGGYTHMGSLGERSFSAWNVGGGVDFWTGNHFGVRTDFRLHVRPDPRGAVQYRGPVQYWSLRGGICVR